MSTNKPLTVHDRGGFLDNLEGVCLVSPWTQAYGEMPPPARTTVGYPEEQVVGAIANWLETRDDEHSSNGNKNISSYSMNPRDVNNNLYFDRNEPNQINIADNSTCIAETEEGKREDGIGRVRKAVFKDRKGKLHMRTYYPDISDKKVLLKHCYKKSGTRLYNVDDGKIAQNAKWLCPPKLLDLVYDSLKN